MSPLFLEGVGTVGQLGGVLRDPWLESYPIILRGRQANLQPGSKDTAGSCSGCGRQVATRWSEAIREGDLVWAEFGSQAQGSQPSPPQAV